MTSLSSTARFVFVAIMISVTSIPTDAFVQHKLHLLVDNMNHEHHMTKDVNIDEARRHLERGYTKQIFSRKPLKLDYKTSRRWIQRNWNPKTKEEFYDLVANGNLRTPYISKQPEKYYGERGQWISWDHYLLVTDEDDEQNGTDEQQTTRWG